VVALVDKAGFRGVKGEEGADPVTIVVTTVVVVVVVVVVIVADFESCASGFFTGSG